MADERLSAPPGRPRDESLDRRTLDAAWQLLGTKPLSQISINEIANLAGTTRPSIYRRWSSVDEIVMDAFLDAIEPPKLPLKSGTPSEQLRAYIMVLGSLVNSKRWKIVAEILGRAQLDATLRDRFHEGFTAPRREFGEQLIRRGQEDGSFRTDIPVDVVIDLYAGPLYFRSSSQHIKVDERFSRYLADCVLCAIETCPSK